MPAVTTTPEQRVKKARTVATKAINNAAKLVADESKSRSTRTRAAYKSQAEALVQVARILSGKE